MVHVKSLKFNYRKSNLLFDNLDLSLEAGNIYGLFGLNGSGKTTLIRLISGLLFPKSGEVTINSHFSKNRDVEMLRDIFVIPEEFWLPSINIKKYVNIHAGLYPNFDNKNFDNILKEFELDLHLKLDHLSYGQKKKFLIAFGIASNTSLLIMDEPTNGLDIPSKSQFRKIMASFISADRCVLISTHQVRDLSSIIDHVIVLHDRKICFNESTEVITQNFGFGISHELNENVIYSEDIFGGKAIIYKNNGKDTEIDFELLFKGLIKNAQVINNSIQRRS